MVLNESKGFSDCLEDWIRAVPDVSSGNLLFASIDFSVSTDPVGAVIGLQNAAGSDGRLILQLICSRANDPSALRDQSTQNPDTESEAQPIRRLVSSQGLRAFLHESGLLAHRMSHVKPPSTDSADHEEGGWVSVASASRGGLHDEDATRRALSGTNAQYPEEGETVSAIARARRRADVMASYVRRSRAGLLEAHEQLAARDDEFLALSTELLSRIDQLESAPGLGEGSATRPTERSEPPRRFKPTLTGFFKLSASWLSKFRGD